MNVDQMGEAYVRMRRAMATTFLKDVHKPRKEYAIWLNFGYVVVYLKILRLDFFQIFLPRRLVVMRAQSRILTKI